MFIYSLGSVQPLILISLSWAVDRHLFRDPFKFPNSKLESMTGTRTCAVSSPPTVNFIMLESSMSKYLFPKASSGETGTGPPSDPSSPVKRRTLVRCLLGMSKPMGYDFVSVLFLLCCDSTGNSSWCVHQHRCCIQ